MAVNQMFFERFPEATLEHQIQVRPYNVDKTSNMRSLNPEGLWCCFYENTLYLHWYVYVANQFRRLPQSPYGAPPSYKTTFATEINATSSDGDLKLRPYAPIRSMRIRLH
jgi:hypothetical protein